MNFDLGGLEFRHLSPILNNLRKRGISWEDIRSLEYLSRSNSFEENLELFNTTVGGDYTQELFQEIVAYKEDEETTGIDTFVIPNEASIIPATRGELVPVDDGRGSAWTHYKNVLKDKGFNEETTIADIRNSAQKCLSKLSKDTRNSDAIKGLVVGNVQAGKTANMAALIAMAADAGYNFFIVLTGTIENLREQNQKRLVNDLVGNYNIKFQGLEHLRLNCDLYSKLSNLYLNETDNLRYLVMCLKNSTRLNQLLKWLNSDDTNRQKLKILLIDDEADQAGINTLAGNNSEMSEDAEQVEERTAVNKAIVNIVNNRTFDSKPISKHFKAINYVMYTATPYANVLNEKPGPNSLYPTNFVSCIKYGDTYIGPQHIFGLRDTNVDGMNIINEVSVEEVEHTKEVCKRHRADLPESLKDAVLWFYCCFAIWKHWGLKKPVSMLIHTSQTQSHHQALYEALKDWISSLDELTFIKMCKKVYEKQTSQFTLKDFKNAYKDYGLPDINDYPKFTDISNELLTIIKAGIKHVLIDSNEQLVFNNGVNLCVDNCSSFTKSNDNEHIRLIYPEPGTVDYPTGFIVIGGATLSRGLTIEGLVSTYFLRTVKTADTLMQMGRWFGYRNHYELLPRIWMSKKTKEQYKFLSDMDFDLRQRIKDLEETDISPALIGVKIMTHPKASFLNLTANNRQNAATVAAVSYSGLATQTTKFYSDDDIVNNNFRYTEEFISSLGEDKDNSSNKHFRKNSHLWVNVPNDTVIDYLSKLTLPEDSGKFPDMKYFKKWYKEIAEKHGISSFNILLASKKSNEYSSEIEIAGHKVNTVNRSKKINSDSSDPMIRIGALRNIQDFYADIDVNNAHFNKIDANSFERKDTSAFKQVRKSAGLGKTTLLVIYVIDKDSKPRDGDTSRITLGTCNHLIGLALVIPESGDKQNDKNFVSIDTSDTTYNPLDGGDFDEAGC